MHSKCEISTTQELHKCKVSPVTQVTQVAYQITEKAEVTKPGRWV